MFAFLAVVVPLLFQTLTRYSGSRRDYYYRSMGLTSSKKYEEMSDDSGHYSPDVTTPHSITDSLSLDVMYQDYVVLLPDTDITRPTHEQNELMWIEKDTYNSLIEELYRLKSQLMLLSSVIQEDSLLERQSGISFECSLTLEDTMGLENDSSESAE